MAPVGLILLVSMIASTALAAPVVYSITYRMENGHLNFERRNGQISNSQVAAVAANMAAWSNGRFLARQAMGGPLNIYNAHHFASFEATEGAFNEMYMIIAEHIPPQPPALLVAGSAGGLLSDHAVNEDDES